MGRIVAAIAAMTLLAGCAPTASQSATRAPTTAWSAAPTMEPEATSCVEAPSAIVEMINAAFTDGERLEHTQAVNAPNDMTYVGGNIFGADGTKESSQDTWLVSNGALHALTSDARRRTMLPDGRDVDPAWGQYNAQVNRCVGQVERAANAGR
jgi:hypothetical protein